MHYYNEHNAYRAAVLRERISEGLLPQGVVDERDIQTVPDEDFLGYEQVHLFAGIGGFPLGLRLAGFPEHVRIVDGGFPCQDISNAGKRAGITGSRSRLWREMVRCIRVVRPQFVFVENVAALLCRGMGEVLGDLAEIGYDARGDCISAADVGAPHLRRRIWIVAHARSEQHEGDSVANEWPRAEELFTHAASDLRRTPGDGGPEPLDGSDSLLANTAETRCGAGECCESGTPRDEARRPQPERLCADVSHTQAIGRDRRILEQPRRGTNGRPDVERSDPWPVEPNVGRVAHGVPKRVDRLAALGDAIVPQCAAEAVRRLFFGNKP